MTHSFDAQLPQQTTCSPAEDAAPMCPHEEAWLAVMKMCHSEAQQKLAHCAFAVLETLLAKNTDYGCSAWQRPVMAQGISARQAILCRMSDKVARVGRLAAGHDAQIFDESLDDTIADLAGYCFLYLTAPTE